MWNESKAEHDIWSHILPLLKDLALRRAAYPPVYLGFGSEDRYISSDELLAKILPADRVIVLQGGHDWKIWKKLWEIFLDRPDIPTGSSPSTGLK